MGALIRGHGVDHGFDRLECVVVDVYVFKSFTYTRYHGCEVFDVTHLLQLLYLVVEVGVVVFVLCNFLLQALGFFLIELLLRTFHEADDVAHAEDAVGHSFGVEGVEGFHLLACADKFDWLVNNGADGQCCTTAGVAVEFCEDDSVDFQTFVEHLGSGYCFLTNHRIDYEEGFLRVDGVFDVAYLNHQFFVNRLTSGCIDDDYVVAVCLGELDGVLCHFDRVGGSFFQVAWNAYLLGKYAELFHSCRTEGVAGSQQGFLMFLLCEPEGEFSRHGGFSGTVQTSHEDDGRFAREVDFGILATHQLSQFVVDNLDHQLTRFNGCENVLTEGFLLHCVGEGLGYFVVYVGFEKCLAHILQGFRYVDFGDFSFTLEYFK